MKSNSKRCVVSAIVLACASLAGCGGGGGGSATATAATGPVASTKAFPVASAMKALLAAGMNKNFSVSGTCAGTANFSQLPPASGASFEGASGLQTVLQTVSMTVTNCSLSNAVSSEIVYLDSNYELLGSKLNSSYVVSLPPYTWPASATVGTTGSIGTQIIYRDSTKTVPTGRHVVSYVVEPDTADTAIVNIVSKTYDASNTLTSTEQDRYRVAATGALDLISAETLLEGSSAAHLVLK